MLWCGLGELFIFDLVNGPVDHHGYRYAIMRTGRETAYETVARCRTLAEARALLADSGYTVEKLIGGLRCYYLGQVPDCVEFWQWRAYDGYRGDLHFLDGWERGRVSDKLRHRDLRVRRVEFTGAGCVLVTETDPARV